MKSYIEAPKKRRFSACGLATVLLGASLVVAKSYDIAVDTPRLAAAATEETLSVFAEDKDMHKSQEDWVQLTRVVDPVVVDSVAGEASRDSAADVVADSPFEPAEDDGVDKAGAREARLRL